MTHDEAEKRVKGLQKDFLVWIEEHPALANINAHQFNELRRRIFRSTFQVFRLGVVGLVHDRGHQLYPHDGYLTVFVGWATASGLRFAPEVQLDISEKCLVTALDAYRLGVLVSLSKDQEDPDEVFHG